MFTGAGLTVIAAALIVGVHLPRPPGSTSPELDRGPAERAAVALETIVETLKTIAGASPAPQNLSVTIQLDKDQWQNAAAGLRDIVEGMAGKADGIDAGVKKIAETADRISIDVKGVAKNTGRIERGVRGVVIGVEKVAETADHISTDVKGVAENTRRIERGVRGVAYGTAYLADAMGGVSAHVNGLDRAVGLLQGKVDDLQGMARPWACVAPDCLGAVHFPHNWPLEPDPSLACPDITMPSKIVKPVTEDLEKVAGKLIEKLGKPNTVRSIAIVGHASTDGSSAYNTTLSAKRAKFVECHLKKHQELKEWIAKVKFKICSTGEEASTGNLRHPDSWYRVVQVFLAESPGGIAACGSG